MARGYRVLLPIQWKHELSLLKAGTVMRRISAFMEIKGGKHEDIQIINPYDNPMTYSPPCWWAPNKEQFCHMGLKGVRFGIRKGLWPLVNLHD